MRVPLTIKGGINRDDTLFSVGSGAWADADRVRFWRGQPQVIGGWEKFTQDTLKGACRGIHAYTDLDANLIGCFGTPDSLEVSYGGELYDITPLTFVPGNVNGTGGKGYGTGTYGSGEYGEPSPGDAFAMTWSLSNYGQTLVANPRGQTIFITDLPFLTPATALTNAPEQVTYTLVVPQRQVMALGCNEEVSGDFNPLAIRFSDIEDITDWTTSPDNNAGEVILEGGGRIVGARLIGDLVYVWTDSSLFRGQFLGNPDQTWRFDRVGDHCGLIGPNAAVVLSQVAYWLTSELQFYQCALGGAATPIQSPVQADMKEIVQPIQTDKIFASSCSQFGEVRWDLPDIFGDATEDIEVAIDAVDIVAVDDDDDLAVSLGEPAGTEVNRYVTVNVLEGSWSRGRMQRTSMLDAGPGAYPIGTDAFGNIFIHERGQTADGDILEWSLESADQYITDASQLLMLKGVWPDFQSQQGSVSLEVITRKYPQAPERSHGPYVLTPDKSKKDFRATGRVARIKLSGASAPSFVRVGKPEFEAEGSGFQ